MNNETIKAIVILTTDEVFAEGFIEYTDTDAKFYGRFAEALLEEQTKREETLADALMKIIEFDYERDNPLAVGRIALDAREKLGLGERN